MGAIKLGSKVLVHSDWNSATGEDEDRTREGLVIDSWKDRERGRSVTLLRIWIDGDASHVYRSTSESIRLAPEPKPEEGAKAGKVLTCTSCTDTIPKGGTFFRNVGKQIVCADCC